MTQEEVALKWGLCKCHDDYKKRGLKDPDCPWHQFCIDEAMDEWAKLNAIEFFKWYGVKMASFMAYITKVRPIMKSEEIEERIQEFEGQTFEKLYELFLKSK